QRGDGADDRVAHPQRVEDLRAGTGPGRVEGEVDLSAVHVLARMVAVGGPVGGLAEAHPGQVAGAQLRRELRSAPGGAEQLEGTGGAEDLAERGDLEQAGAGVERDGGQGGQ